MALNFPGPFEVRLTQTALFASDPLAHTQRLSVDLTTDPPPGTGFLSINVKTKGGILTPTLASAIEAWLTLLKVQFADETSFGIVELWKYVPLSFEASFISSYNPTVVLGTSLDTTVKANQEIYTFRTTEGGIMRINLMETVRAVGLTISYPTGDAAEDAIFDFITSDANWILARDTSYPLASLNFLPGQNEKSFRQRFR